MAQQLPQFSHYGFNGMYISPGYAGITERTELTGIFRYQWVGYQGSFDDGGSPRTGLFSLSLPLHALKGGIGVSVLQDQLGATTISNANVAYSQHIKIGSGRLGIGIQGGITRISKGNYRAIDLDDPSVPFNSSDRKFDMGAGIWYQAEKFYFGLGANNLLRSKFVFEDVEGSNTTGTGTVTAENHIYLTGGVNIPVSSSVIVTPTAIAKYDLNQLSLEAGARATINEKYWLGAGYRVQEAITGLAGVSFLKENALKFGLAYDLTNFGVEAKTKSSYELMLSYIFPKPANLKRPPVKTPRYNF